MGEEKKNQKHLAICEICAVFGICRHYSGGKLYFDE